METTNTEQVMAKVILGNHSAVLVPWAGKSDDVAQDRDARACAVRRQWIFTAVVVIASEGGSPARVVLMS